MAFGNRMPCPLSLPIFSHDPKNKNQKKERSIFHLLVLARPERAAFGLSLAGSASELMNVRMTSLESSSPPESVESLSYSSSSLSSVSLL